MPASSDTKRPRSVKVEFDPEFDATTLGGFALAEQTLRSLGLMRLIRNHLPARNPAARFSTQKGVYALAASLLAGGRGIQAAEVLRRDSLALEIAGLEKAPSASTTYRILCDLAGLKERKESECYEPARRGSLGLDIFGEERKARALRRIVPETPEAASAENRARLNDFTTVALHERLSHFVF